MKLLYKIVIGHGKFCLFVIDINLKYRNILIVCDFNIDEVASERNYRDLLDICYIFNLANFINENTRIDSRKGFHLKKCLDHTFTKITSLTTQHNSLDLR